MITLQSYTIKQYFTYCKTREALSAQLYRVVVFEGLPCSCFDP